MRRYNINLTQEQALECCALGEWRGSKTHEGSFALHVTDKLITYIQSLPGGKEFDPENAFMQQKTGNAIASPLIQRFCPDETPPSISTARLEEGTLLRVTNVVKQQIDREISDKKPDGPGGHGR